MTIQKYIDSALTSLKEIGKGIVGSEEDSQLVSILDEIKEVDEPRVLAIAQTVQYIGSFNQLVRDNVKGMDVDDRYNTINEAFTSIRDDSKMLVNQLEDGKIDLKEKAQNLWMKLSRGSTHHRFEKIKDVYKKVSEDTNDQLGHEEKILNSYQDFRFALKESEAIANEVLSLQEKKRDESKNAFMQASETVDKFSGNDAEKSKLQLTRDVAKTELEKQEANYQLIKDVAENISNSYNVGETLMAKLKQTHDLKNQVYRKSVIFFTTNENVFTTMDAVYTSQHGLHETTQTLEAMKTGANKGLEDVAELGTKLETAAIEAGYGSTYSPESVKKLVDAIVNYQTESLGLIDKFRKESAQSTKEIETIVEDGKRRTRDALSNYLTASSQQAA